VPLGKEGKFLASDIGTFAVGMFDIQNIKKCAKKNLEA
jgi:hypothetical protein